jgi:hypothetical protein
MRGGNPASPAPKTMKTKTHKRNSRHTPHWLQRSVRPSPLRWKVDSDLVLSVCLPSIVPPHTACAESSQIPMPTANIGHLLSGHLALHGAQTSVVAPVKQPQPRTAATRPVWRILLDLVCSYFKRVNRPNDRTHRREAAAGDVEMQTRAATAASRSVQ